MNDHSLAREVARAITKAGPTPTPLLVMAVVTARDVETCSVSIANEVMEGVRWLREGYFPEVGDPVYLIRNGSDAFILGSIYFQSSGIGGQLRSFTPTLLNGWDTGDGACVYRYQRIGNLCHYRFVMTFGSGLATPSGELIQFTAPFTRASGYPTGPVLYENTGTKLWHGSCILQDQDDPQVVTLLHESGTAGFADDSSPFTFGVGDRISGSVTYEVFA